MIKSFEIYFRDLNDEAQKEVLKFYEIQTLEQANLDTFPISVINTKTVAWEGNPIFSLPVSN